MPRDPLRVLWRVRDAAVTAASRELSEARAVEADHMARLGAHDVAMRCEQEDAVGLSVADFVAWLPYARQRAEALRKAAMAEQVRVARLQRALVVRRTEAEAVVKAMARRDEAAGRVAARRVQAAMDEAAGRSGAMRLAGGIQNRD